MTKCVICSDTRRGLSQHPLSTCHPEPKPPERITFGKDWAHARDLPRCSQGLPGTFRSRFLGLIDASVNLEQQSGLGPRNGIS